MKLWSKKTQEEIKEKIFFALKRNVNYYEENILGVPASHLDREVFPHDAGFLKDAPYISTLIHNPNHIGCHTVGESENFFRGTQEIEREVIELCAVDILKAEENSVDGYVASGGTEANMQAIWIYRNYYRRRFGASNDQICILCSEDSHYSMDKSANVLAINIRKIKVDDNERTLDKGHLEEVVTSALKEGMRYFIVVNNMMTTMFGSIDDIETYVEVLEANDCAFKIHIDGAYGGFFYPFSNHGNVLNFAHPHVTSVTLDAHKMAQAPYGTGLFLIRKDWIQYANTQEASYVEGEDFTLIGSRSGANAIAIWMILMKNGPYSWQEKNFILLKRTTWVCDQLNQLGVEYFRDQYSNIITMRASFIDADLAAKYGLVPNNHKNPDWYKIVIMDHVSIEKLAPFVEELKGHLQAN